MRTKLLPVIAVCLLVASPGLFGQQPQAPPRGPVFTSNSELVLVDVDVRDHANKPVEGLTQNDFEVLEDGKPQQVLRFSYEKVAPTNKVIDTASTLAKTSTDKGAVP